MTTETKIKRDLRNARFLISDIGNWTTNCHALNSLGIEVRPWIQTACCWCADGALAKACQVREWNTPGARYRLAYAALNDAAQELYEAEIVDVNDGLLSSYGIPANASSDEYFAAQHAAVLACFDKAIEEYEP